MTLMDNCPTFRETRRMFRTSIGGGKASEHLDTIGVKLDRYLEKLSEEPGDFIAHNKWCVP
jgi:hypothetical protein